jgi:hypothetical protein
MILDKLNIFSPLAGQTVTTGSNSGILSDYSVDLGIAARNIGVGEDLYVVAQVVTLMAGQGDTCEVRLVTAAYAALNSPTMIASLGTFPANSVAGTRLIAKLPPSNSYLRYIGIEYITSGSGELSAGAFSAFLVKDIDAFTAYADNITIS